MDVSFDIYDDDGEYLTTVSLSQESAGKIMKLADERREDFSSTLMKLILDRGR